VAVLIFANGDIQEVEWIRPYLAGATAVIAANGGTTHLLALDNVPDVVIGDMDSLSLAERERLERAGTRFIIHPAAKDETDLELALSYAVITYEDEILLFGTLGGRLDQTLANILLLAHPILKERRVYLVNQYERAWLVEVEGRIQGAVGDTVSLIPLGGDARILATTGLRWPLMNDVLAFGPARGVSNVMTAEVATITVESGRLLCIHTWREQGQESLL
jgi:thiamine pyrophosphokinase